MKRTKAHQRKLDAAFDEIESAADGLRLDPADTAGTLVSVALEVLMKAYGAKTAARALRTMLDLDPGDGSKTIHGNA